MNNSASRKKINKSVTTRGEKPRRGKNPLLIILIGCVYVIEGVSVILQVLCYKTTGKRIFKMAPLHHHLERCGMSENKICVIAMIITFLLSVPAFFLYLA